MRKEMNDIVLVDDNPAICYGLSEIFKRRGYAVRTASDGFSALALIRDRAPGILLSDLDMPGMSGFELLSVVRRRFPAIAVIAMRGAYSSIFVPSGVADWTAVRAARATLESRSIWMPSPCRNWSANDHHVLQRPRDRGPKRNFPKTVRVGRKPWP